MPWAHSTQGGPHVNAALCFRRLLHNLRKLTLDTVAVPLPALQPVATRLHALSLSGSRLEGSADGFLTEGWTALTSLSLNQTRMQNATLTAALKLPALQDVRIFWFTGHQGGELHLHQLTGSCPQVSSLEFQLGRCLRQVTGASRQRCRVIDLIQLVDLHVMDCSLQTKMDLDLAPSLTQLKFGGLLMGGSSSVDFFWALREAVKCIGRGAQLHKLICSYAKAYLQHVQWGANLDEQHRRIGGMLGGLRELEVWGAQDQLFSAVGAVATAAPSLVRLEIVPEYPLSRVEVSPICSASLESVRVKWGSSLPPLGGPTASADDITAWLHPAPAGDCALPGPARRGRRCQDPLPLLQPEVHQAYGWVGWRSY